MWKIFIAYGFLSISAGFIVACNSADQASEVTEHSDNLPGFSGLKPGEWVDVYSKYLSAQGELRSNYYDNYGKLLQAEGNYKKTLADVVHRLAEARKEYWKSEYIRVRTAIAAQELRFWDNMVDQFELELDRLREDERKTRIKIERIRSNGQSTRAMMVTGRVTSNNLRSLDRLMMDIESSASVAFMFTDVDAMAADQFVLNGDSLHLQTQAFDGGSMTEMLEFLETNRFSMRAGGLAHRAFAQAFINLDAATTDRFEELKTSIITLREATMDYWEEMAQQIRTTGQSPLGVN